MVQIKLESPLLNFSKNWGPSLSDCLEIHTTFQKGVANKGTWRSVSLLVFFFHLVSTCIDFFGDGFD